MASEDVVKPPSALPPYPEMIYAAIGALNDEGSNKTAIIKHIEATYGDKLPDGHSSLLSAHLERMKDSGELLFIKNNYVKPGPGAPAKRGRGRPPKDKSADEAAAEPKSPSSPKSRGRPPKPKDPIDAAATKEPKKTPGRPGRPAKPPATESPAGEKPDSTPVTGVKRGRGRPPKVKPVAVEAAPATAEAAS